MARGDGGKAIFETAEDRKSFLFRLGQVCASHGWKVHAWVLMGNHFHLLLETPEANLVTGMKWLLGTFSQGWNARRSRRGHVFQGRYKAVPVSANVESPYYFRIVADYIHLNPARAGLAGGGRGKLVSYKWSSLPDYARGRGADWLVMKRVWDAFELSDDGRGRRAYIDWLEKRAANSGGEVDGEAMKALRRGWYLGEPSFVERLRSLVEPDRKRRVGGDSVARGHDEAEAGELASRALRAVGLPVGVEGLSELRKGDGGKVLVAALLRKRTAVGNRWLAERLAMGHTSAVSRLVSAFLKDGGSQKRLIELEKMLK